MEQALITFTNYFKKSWQIYSKNFRLFLMPIIVIIALSIIFSLFNLIKGTNNILSGLMIIPVIFIIFILAFIYLWMTILIIKLANGLYKNQAIDLKQLSQESMKKIPYFFWVGIIMGLIVFLGFVLLIIPGIIFLVWYYFSPYISVLEEKNNSGMAALKSSKDLVKGRWFNVVWRLILPYLAIYLPVAIIEIIIMGVIGTIIYASNFDENMIALILTPLNLILDIFNLCLAPLFICFTIVLYNNLKETKAIEIQNPETPTQPTV